MRLALLAVILAIPLLAFAQADLYMKDTPLDTGVEPNPDNGAMWVTEDIWVRNSPDPAYQPYPFTEASPPWTPAPHQNPEYRDPKYSVPNYVYIRVRNRGNAASTGSERLKLYWAKAATGLNWQSQWVDYKDNDCGPTKLYGMEITKPRRNAASPLVSATERNTYRDAIIAVGTQPGFVFPGGVSYWHKQDEVHDLGPANRHNSPAFLPWHREFVNRYEVLLQEYEPTLKLLYWDWTTPLAGPPFNFLTSSFMGSGSGSIGAPFLPALSPPGVTRSVGSPFPLTGTSDATVLAPTTYGGFDNIEGGPHDDSHIHIGGNTGDMSFFASAAEDPIFFLLHGNVDRLWSRWQRNNSFVSRLDPTQTYGTLTSNVNITTAMAPWNGTGPAVQPWTGAGGYIVSKTPTHPSVVSPPIYDDAPLVIPPLAPGQAVVLQVPWYPPNPADFVCFGAEQSHFCLLGRIETTNSAPWGMTTPETTSVYNNTKANNNIAWKNLTVVDNFPGALKLSGIIVRNPFLVAVTTRLRLLPVAEREDPDFFETGRVFVDLPPEVYRRWQEGGGEGTDVRPVDAERGRVAITGRNAAIVGLKLEPEETFALGLGFELNKEYQPRAGTVPKFDLVQIGTPKDENEVVGGQRFELDFRKLVLVPADDEEWRYLDTGAAEDGWREADYDDSGWRKGRAELGYADDPETTIGGRVTTYYRRTFDVADPAVYRNVLLHLKRDDGAAVYLNGAEIHRVNLPDDAGDDTRASASVNGVAEEAYFPVDVPLKLLKAGRNAIAVELHQDGKGDDASFDLTLSANHAVRDTPPSVAILSPPTGTLVRTGEEVAIVVDALDPDGIIKGVQLFIDGKLVGSSATAPATFLWPGTGAGAHRVRAVALNSEQTRRTEITLNVVDNVPPAAHLAAPADGGSFKAGEAIEARADAADRDGKVARVEFWIREGNFIGSRPQLVSSDTTAPFTASLPTDLAPGHYMVWAVAVDDRGEESPSLMAHIAIVGEGGHGGH
ncbi:MAG TPA: tyrosinase family protein [Thermoanaerobaculia bacterium]|nr:tyrosinase family protein [Thermoanaerobaculia bacterium]